MNTVVVEEGELHGTNTDGSGFVGACEEAGVGFAGARVLLVGAGGAAAAIAAPVLNEGVPELRILNRSSWRAEQLRERLKGGCPDADISVYPLSEPRRAALGVDVVVNATYLGMKGDDPLPIPAHCLEAT